jgi:hypothetical protein
LSSDHDNAWIPLLKVFIYWHIRQGLEGFCRLACHSLSVSFVLFLRRSFRFFNGTHNLILNNRFQIFRFVRWGSATECLQYLDFLTPNHLWPFKAWRHYNKRNILRSWILEYVLEGGDSNMTSARTEKVNNSNFYP